METLLGKIYRELRYRKKVRNQTDFGDKLGYNKGYISTILKSAQPPSAELCNKLEKVFGVSRKWILADGEGSIDMFGSPVEVGGEVQPIDRAVETENLNTLIRVISEQSASVRDSAAA
jgi:transcriptional regulator with XRE-family HTH domain